MDETEPCYSGFDPFTGDKGVFGNLGLVARVFAGFPDELGVVVDSYFLATSYRKEDVRESPLQFPNPKFEEKYNKKRASLLYTPFEKVEPRRLWGAESPIELFLHQELLRRDLSPQLQVIICNDGSTHVSLYHLWRDIEFRHAPGNITNADMYFPEQKVAVFCDSARWHRGAKVKAKDGGISARLNDVGIKSVRVPGKLIVDDLKAAADLVSAALTP